MSSLIIFLQAMVVGFVIAAPVGPIGILCIKRTLMTGFWAGIVTGLGSALAGATYGTLVVFGLTAITSFITSEIFWIKLFGGVLLMILGARELWSLQRHTLSFANTDHTTLMRSLSTAFVVALSNPMTLIGYFSMVPALAANFCCTPAQGVVLVGGIFTGSLSWWLLLSSIVTITRRRLPQKFLNMINIGSGIVLIGFGLFVFMSALVL